VNALISLISFRIKVFTETIDIRYKGHIGSPRSIGQT
jgi:hypothetical protein